MRPLHRKSNAAVTFTDAQSDNSFLIVYNMRVRANIAGQERRAIIECCEVFKARLR
jgi:hypothetical protein